MANLTLENKTLLGAALEGLELQRTRLEEQIRQVKIALGHAGVRRRGRPPKSLAVSRPGAETAPAAAGRAKKKTRNMSAAARKRIADAQKKRWANFRKEKKDKSKSEA